MTLLRIVLGALLWANIAGAAEVVDVALAASVSEREPVGVFTPAATCQTSAPSASRVPLVDPQAYHGVYVWTKIAASQASEIHHRYYMETGDGFTVAANVVLSVDPAEGYRTWSSKSISPRSLMHQGMWKVDIVEVGDADRVLCSIYFNVE
jgi:hypothetical protein